MKTILLCPPTAYEIVYEINPWMHTENKVDSKKVAAEYAALKHAYEELGLAIYEIPQSKGFPDMVYSANFGFPIGNTFIKTNYKYAERKKEADLAKTYFEKLGFTIQELPESINWEGQGDLLTIGGKFFLGWGKRSDLESKPYLEKIIGKSIIDFELINPYYYHLDTCFTPLDEETVAINPVSFTKDGLAELHRQFPNIIEVSPEDNNIIACNAVVVEKTIVIAKGISQELKEQYAKYGFITREVPMDEYRKGGGSVKCLTLEWYS